MMREMLWHLVLLDFTRTIVEQDALTTSQQQFRVLAIINLLMKKKTDKSINFKRLGNCYNCGKPNHWANTCLKPKKSTKTNKVSSFKNKPTRSQIKGKEEIAKAYPTANTMEDEF